MARVPPSRHLMSCGLWVPGGRTEPFFPLGARRPSPTTNSRNPLGLSAPRLASVPSDITLHPSRASASVLRASCCDSLPAALFAAHYVYNTVVLGVLHDCPSLIEFEMAYQAQGVGDRIRFTIRHVEQFAQSREVVSKVSLQLPDALDRLDELDRQFQIRSRMAFSRNSQTGLTNEDASTNNSRSR